MKIFHRLVWVFALAIILFVTGAYSRGEELHKIADEYRGFHVDYSEVTSNPELEIFRAAMNKQIDMVLATGVPAKMLGFFKSVPIRVHLGRESFAGHYTGKSKTVELTSEFLSKGHKPALLHEFLHAYHDQQMPGGFKNREVLKYYERAKASNAYDANSHMMANVKEYFASASHCHPGNLRVDC